MEEQVMGDLTISEDTLAAVALQALRDVAERVSPFVDGPPIAYEPMPVVIQNRFPQSVQARISVRSGVMYLELYPREVQNITGAQRIQSGEDYRFEEGGT